MRKHITTIPILMLIIFVLTGCSSANGKSDSLSIIYGISATLSLLLLIVCIHYVKKHRFWFVTLFFSVFVVNLGYTLLSISTCLEMALWANRLSYLGSVFLPLSMLMIVLKVTNTPHTKALPKILLGLAIVIFMIAASPGILPIYYKEVSFAVVDGVSTLIKVYGPLHPLYLVYLLGYFGSMVSLIIRAHIKKSIDSAVHATFLTLAVFVNIGVWLIEQFISIEFEILSISYIISELFLLGVNIIMSENQRLHNIVKQVELAQNYVEEATAKQKDILEKPIDCTHISPERIESFMHGIEHLTPTEKAIYDAHITRITSKEIMSSMNIKESTLKYHNRNIYGKLDVSTKEELLEIHKHIKSVKESLTK